MVASQTARLTADEVESLRDPAFHARLRELTVEYYEFVWRSLRRLGVRPPETDDAAQRVFLVLAQKLSSIHPDKERSFIFGIAMRVAANVRRDLATAREREVAESDSLESIAPGPTAETAVARAQERATLDEILASIPEERRGEPETVLVRTGHMLKVAHGSTKRPSRGSSLCSRGPDARIPAERPHLLRR